MPNFLKCAAATLALLPLAAACDRGPELTPVRGKVLYNGAPLEFGAVMFQPVAGQPAQALIGPDGAFELQVPERGKGAVVGRNLVRITCYTTQNPAGPAANGEALGALLIPEKYTQYATSGLEYNLPLPNDEPLVIELSD